MSEIQNNVIREENTENGVAEEPSLTMLDILEQEKELEEESAAVLGGSDEKCCTYNLGYIKRQALYSCLTCSPDATTDISKSAGICLACSYQCHENHELIELYTKRDFRCDCPTDRIIGKKCSFVTTAANGNACAAGSSRINKAKGFEKYPENQKNIYNQNFSGLYCICNRPYPDPEDPIQDEMIQCIGCEDWYHTRHLGIVGPVPKNIEYSEMICEKCIKKYDFLIDYSGLAVNKIDNKLSSDNLGVKIDDENDDKLKSDLNKSISDIMNIPEEQQKDGDDDKETTKEDSNKNTDSTLKNARSTEAIAEPSAKRFKFTNDDTEIDNNSCKRPIIPTNYTNGAIFWSSDWRTMLCTCLQCTKLYANKMASFLLEPEDTVQCYEENGLKKFRESDYERGIRALSSMEHTKQIDAITEYNKMKDKLKEYLHTFVVNNKVVTEEDITTFFEQMKNNNKNSSKVGNQPHFCR